MSIAAVDLPTVAEIALSCPSWCTGGTGHFDDPLDRDIYCHHKAAPVVIRQATVPVAVFLQSYVSYDEQNGRVHREGPTICVEGDTEELTLLEAAKLAAVINRFAMIAGRAR